MRFKTLFGDRCPHLSLESGSSMASTSNTRPPPPLDIIQPSPTSTTPPSASNNHSQTPLSYHPPSHSDNGPPAPVDINQPPHLSYQPPSYSVKGPPSPLVPHLSYQPPSHLDKGPPSPLDNNPPTPLSKPPSPMSPVSSVDLQMTRLLEKMKELTVQLTQSHHDIDELETLVHDTSALVQSTQITLYPPEEAAERPVEPPVNIKLNSFEKDILNGYLSDVHICTYIDNIIEAPKLTRIIIPSVTQLIKHTNKPKELCEQLQLKKFVNVLLVVNNGVGDKDEGSHWSLLYFDRVTNIFYHIDSSVNNMNYKSALIICDKISEGMNKRKIKIVQTPCLKQNNGIDCGIHVLKNMQVVCTLISLGLPLQNLYFDNPVNTRQIRHTLFKLTIADKYYPLNPRNECRIIADEKPNSMRNIINQQPKGYEEPEDNEEPIENEGPQLHEARDKAQDNISTSLQMDYEFMENNIESLNAHNSDENLIPKQLPKKSKKYLRCKNPLNQQWIKERVFKSKAEYHRKLSIKLSSLVNKYLYLPYNKMRDHRKAHMMKKAQSNPQPPDVVNHQQQEVDSLIFNVTNSALSSYMGSWTVS